MYTLVLYIMSPFDILLSSFSSSCVQMSGLLGRLTSPGTLTAAVVGGAALTGMLYYRRGNTVEAGAAPG